MSIAWNDIVAALIASVVAGISLLGFVYQYALKPRIAAQIGQEILIHYTEAGQLILTANFVFVNRGALPTAMTGLFGTIWADDSTQPGLAKLKDPNLTWRQYEEIKRTSPIGTKAVYASGSSGAVETLVIPGRGASPPLMIRLYSKENLPLESLYPKESTSPGPRIYTLALRAIDGSTRGNKGSTLTCKLFLNEQDEKELREHGKESQGNIKSRISFRRKLSATVPRESFAAKIRSRIPFTRATRVEIIEFVSDGKWSANPAPLPPPGHRR